MSEQEMDFVKLVESVRANDLDAVGSFLELSNEEILSRIGVAFQYDTLVEAALYDANPKMVNLLLKKSNLLQRKIDNLIEESGNETIKKDLKDLGHFINRSNLQKADIKALQGDLKKAKERGWNDVADKLQARLDFEETRRLEGIKIRPAGTSEKRWFLNKNAWTLNGEGGLEYPMYGQDNADAIRDELKRAGIETEYTCYEDKKTNTQTNYRIRVKSEDKEKFKEFLEQKRRQGEKGTSINKTDLPNLDPGRSQFFKPITDEELNEMARKKKEIEASESVENSEAIDDNEAGKGPIEVAEPTAGETADDESFETPEPSDSRGSESKKGIVVSEPRNASDEEHEGMKNGPGFWANWHQYPIGELMSTKEGKSSFELPYYFNPSGLTEEGINLARKMLTAANIRVDENEKAPLDFKKGSLPMNEGDLVWRVSGRDNIENLTKFLNECEKDEDKALGKKVSPVGVAEKDEKSVNWGAVAGKVLTTTGQAIEGVAGGVVDSLKKIGKLDSVRSINAAMDKFNESVFKTGFNSPEEFGSNMLIAIMAFPFDFIDVYLKTKLEKSAESSDSNDSDKKAPSMKDDRKRQHEALKKIMDKMVEKNPKLFYELAKNGVFGDVRDGISQEERAKYAKQFFEKPENEELLKSLKGVFAKVAEENPDLIREIYPADYNGPVRPDVLLRHVMGWGNSSEAGTDRTGGPTTGPALTSMQMMMKQMDELRTEIRRLSEEINRLKEENNRLKAELEDYRLGRVKPGAEVSPSDGIVQSVATNGGGTTDGATPAPQNQESMVAPQSDKKENHQSASKPRKVPDKNGDKKDKSGDQKRKNKEKITIVINMINNSKADSLAANQTEVKEAVNGAMSYISPQEQPKVQKKVQKLNSSVDSVSKKENELSDAQARLREKYPQIFGKYILNEQGKPVNKDNNKTVTADDIRKELGLTKKRDAELYEAATQRGMIAILRAGNEAGYKDTGEGIHAGEYRNKPSSGQKGATNQAQNKTISRNNSGR